jgi:hypothetical protein
MLRWFPLEDRRRMKKLREVSCVCHWMELYGTRLEFQQLIIDQGMVKLMKSGGSFCGINAWKFP